MYDKVIVLQRDVAKSLIAAGDSKAEFKTGDVIENRGADFMQSVNYYMNIYSNRFNKVTLNCDDKDIQQVHANILNRMDIH